MAETQNEVLQESEFVRLLLRSKILSEAQLKAVHDYQRSVGGSVLDILVKLNMLPRSDLEAMLHAAMRGDDVATAVSGRSNVAIDATKLQLGGLKLHHRLIDKIPPEIVERYLVAVFFPGANLDSRKLIVGHGRELPDGMAGRFRSILGVDLYLLHLNEAIAADFVVRYLERAKKPVPEELERLLASKRREERAAERTAKNVESNPDTPVPQDVSPRGGGLVLENPEDTRADTAEDHELDPARDDRTTQDSTRGVSRLMGTSDASNDGESKSETESELQWTALLNLLVKKSVLSREEVRVELELLRRNKTHF